MVKSRLARSKSVVERNKSRLSRLQHRLLFEPLEPRNLLSTFKVVNTNDSGSGSLRDAILLANAHAGADEVKFKHSAEGTITLASELGVTGELTIHGPGADKLTVSGGGTTRVFNIAGGATVKIDDLTIANGFVKGENGGGILNQGTLTLEDSVVTGNKAVRGAPFSGGYGAGIQNQGTLTVKDSTISENAAEGAGGGLDNYYYPATATLDRVTVSNNTSKFPGAGIASFGATLSIDDSMIQGNTTPTGAGGIIAGGKIAITNSTIRDNVGGNAGGLYLGFNYSFLTVNDALVSHSLITHNTASYGAGGVFNTGNSAVRIEYTTISDNLGGYAGGVGSTLRGNVPTVIIGSTISGNTAAGSPTTVIFGEAGSALAGGVLGTSRIENSTISGNTAVGKFSYLNRFGHTVTLQADNVAGGVLAGRTYDYYAPNHSVAASIDHSTIAFNKVTDAAEGANASGGVLGVYHGYGYGNSDIAVRNTIIAKNESNVGDADVNGVFISGGHNLIGVLGGSATGFVPSDLRGTAATPLDPLLLPLHHNGGFTKTHALAKRSPAINAGDNTDAPPTDQRGRQRIVGGTIDIGSYEVQAKHDHDDDRDDDEHDSRRDDFWKNYAPTFASEDEWLGILAGNAGKKRGHRRE